MTDRFPLTCLILLLFSVASVADDDKFPPRPRNPLPTLQEQLDLQDRIARYHPDSSSWTQAIYDKGALLQRNDMHELALVEFQLLLDETDRRIAAGQKMYESEINARASAQWRIGECRFAMKDYRGALESFEATEKYPIQSFCGNAYAQYDYECAMKRGLCCEWLGDHAGAVKHYLRTALDDETISLYFDPLVHRRLADLYESAGQLGDLRKINAAARARQNRDRQQHIPDIIEQLLEIRAWGEQQQWDKLMAELIEVDRGGGRPGDLHACRMQWRAIEAAKVLGAHPKQTLVPLLLQLNKTDDRNMRDSLWVCYALALTKTPQAADALVQRINSDDTTMAEVYLYLLSRAGTAGDHAIKDFKPAPGSLVEWWIKKGSKFIITGYGRDPMDEFPVIPAELHLPSQWP